MPVQVKIMIVERVGWVVREVRCGRSLTEIGPPLMTDSTDAQHRQQRVDWLCCAYPYMPPGRLLRKVEQEIRSLERVRGGRRHSLTVSRDLLEATGWAHLLRACLLQDLGRVHPARVECAVVDSLGRESGQTILRHWAREVRIWQSED